MNGCHSRSRSRVRFPQRCVLKYEGFSGRFEKMSSSLFRNSGERPDNAQAAPKQQAERWRLAVKLVQQMREAGYRCELSQPAQRLSLRKKIGLPPVESPV